MTWIKINKKFEFAFWGLKSSIGILFITVGIGKFNPSFAEYLTNVGLPVELQIPIALAECLGGMFLILGFLTRISSGVLAIIMFGAIMIKQIWIPFELAAIETDLILLAGCLFVLVAGSGQISISRYMQDVPEILK